MSLGITGSRNGLTVEQYNQFKMLTDKMILKEVHHGGCVGVDSEMHQYFTDVRKIKTILHPPLCQDLQGVFMADEVRPPLEYLTRNKNIVNYSDVVIGFPDHEKEIVRSGTWATIRYSKKSNKRTYIVYPSGSVESFNC